MQPPAIEGARRFMLNQVLKQWFWDCYDHLGALFFANVVAFLIFFGFGFVALQLIAPALELFSPQGRVIVSITALLFFATIMISLWFAPVGHFGALVAEEKYPGIKELARGVAKGFLRQLPYVFACMLIICIFLMNAWFYTFSGSIPKLPRLAGYFLSGLCFWGMLLFAASMVVGLPLRGRESLSIKSTIKLSFARLIQFPGTVFGVFLFIVSFSIIGAWLRLAPIFLFGFSGTAMLTSSLYDVLLAHMKQKAETSDHPLENATSWKEIRATEDETERERMSRVRYERTFRDLLRPWEG